MNGWNETTLRKKRKNYTKKMKNMWISEKKKFVIHKICENQQKKERINNK